MISASEIAKRLVFLRGKRTQAEVAKAIGVSQSGYAMYETGDRIPSDERKIAIARFFGKTVQDIFFASEFTYSEQIQSL